MNAGQRLKDQNFENEKRSYCAVVYLDQRKFRYTGPHLQLVKRYRRNYSFQPELFNIAVNEFDAKSSVCYSRCSL